MFGEYHQQINEEVLHFLVHFGEIGFSPKVLQYWHGKTLQIPGFGERTLGIVSYDFVAGPRLYELLDRDAEFLSPIFEELGFRVGYMAQFGLRHGDMHLENLIVHDGKPVIIGWGDASKCEIPDDPNKRYPFFWGLDSATVIRSLMEDISGLHPCQSAKPTIRALSEIYEQGFKSGLATTPFLTEEEMLIASLPILFGPNSVFSGLFE